ncbi:MAG: hypothetical protein GX621_02520, partial [Pirellulaceae bacterium]|nr:hypothetical protein [Pirellulaceae bacterium]
MLPQEPRKDINPPTPTADGDVYGVSAPVSSSVQSELAAEYMAKAARRAVS